MSKPTKILLFFIASTTPTPAEYVAAASNKFAGYSVRFRNASLIERGDKPETCHAVAGKVPLQYTNLENVEVFDTEVEDGDDEAPRALSSLKNDELIALLTKNDIEVPPGLKKKELVELAESNGLSADD